MNPADRIEKALRHFARPASEDQVVLGMPRLRYYAEHGSWILVADLLVPEHVGGALVFNDESTWHAVRMKVTEDDLQYLPVRVGRLIEQLVEASLR